MLLQNEKYQTLSALIAVRLVSDVKLLLPMLSVSLCQLSIFTARGYASAVVAVVVCPSVCPSQAGIVSKRNDWTDRAGFWQGGFLSPIPRFVSTKFGYLQN